MAEVVIAKNLTAGDLDLDQLSIPDAIIPASDQVTLTDWNTVSEIREDEQLRDYIDNDQVVLIVDGEEQTKEQSLHFVSPESDVIIKNNFDAVIGPTVADNEDAGYSVSSRWIIPDPGSGDEWVHVGSGVWTKTSAQSDLYIQDEGVEIPNAPHSGVNFVGAGVTATDGGSGFATVTIAGGGGDTDEDKIIYVGKHGNDTNDGKNIESAVLTFTKAIELCNAQSPSSSNIWGIVCVDGGIYTESITLTDSYVHLFAANATLQGSVILKEDSSVEFEMIKCTSGTAVTLSSGTGTAYIQIKKLDTNSCNGLNNSSSGILNTEIEYYKQTGGIGLQGTSGITHADIQDWDLYGTSPVAVKTTTGTLNLRSANIADRGGSGTSIAFDCNGGTTNALAVYVATDTCYDVESGATLNLVAASCSGNTYNDGTANITQAGVNVTGPGSSTDNAIARYDGTTGQIIQDSSRTIVTDNGTIEVDQEIDAVRTCFKAKGYDHDTKVLEMTSNQGSNDWYMMLGTAPFYNGCLMFKSSTEAGNYTFGIGADGKLKVTDNLNLDNTKTFGSYSHEALAHYKPFDGTNQGQLAFTTVDENEAEGQFDIVGWVKNGAAWENTTMMTFRRRQDDADYVKIFSDLRVDASRSGYILDLHNDKADGGGNGFKILAGEVLGDIAFHIADENNSFQIMELEADQGYCTFGKTYAQTLSDNGVVHGIDIQHTGNAKDFNTQVGTYKIAGVDITLPKYHFFADQLESPVNSNWAINALAPAVADPANAALTVRKFDDSVETGIGFSLFIPSGATNLVLKPKGRAQTAPGSTKGVAFNLYNRGIPDNAAIESWSSATEIDVVQIPTNAYFQYDEITLSLTTLSVETEKVYQFELTRDYDDAYDTLSGNYLLIELQVGFT